MNLSRRLLLPLLCAGLLGASASAPPRVAPWGVDLHYVDSASKPGDNFYAFANGSWLKVAEIPPDRQAAGVALELNKLNEEHLRSLIAGLHTRTDLTAEEQKLRDFYDAFTDEKQIEARGLKPASDDLARIAAVATLEAARDNRAALPVGAVPHGTHRDDKDRTPISWLGQRVRNARRDIIAEDRGSRAARRTRATGRRCSRSRA
jgi:hypothetical protein